MTAQAELSSRLVVFGQGRAAAAVRFGRVGGGRFPSLDFFGRAATPWPPLGLGWLVWRRARRARPTFPRPGKVSVIFSEAWNADTLPFPMSGKSGQ